MTKRQQNKKYPQNNIVKILNTKDLDTGTPQKSKYQISKTAWISIIAILNCSENKGKLLIGGNYEKTCNLERLTKDQCAREHSAEMSHVEKDGDNCYVSCRILLVYYIYNITDIMLSCLMSYIVERSCLV